jgi:tetratricopeptide (TPR) repeat protein
MRPLFLLLTLAPLAADGNPQAILARDDVAFARKLNDAGFHDLARTVCTAVMDAADRNQEEILDARILSFDAEAAEAGDIPDLSARKERLEDILKRAAELADTLPPGPKSDRLNEALAGAQQAFAETLLGMLQNQADPTLAASIRKDADKIFVQAEDNLTKRIETTQEEMENADLTDAEYDGLDRKLIIDMYSRARMYYLHSLLLGPADVKRRLVLRQALDAFTDFQFSYGRQLLAFEGAIYQGLCLKELQENDKAIEKFDFAISLREGFEKRADGKYEVDQDAADVISSAVLQKILFLKDQKDFAGANAAAEDFLTSIPNPDRANQGKMVMLAQAQSMIAAGDATSAITLAQRLVELAPQSPEAAGAREILTSPGGGSAAGPEVQLQIAQTHMSKGDNARAHAACAQARRSSHGTPKEADIGAESFNLDGAAYSREGRLMEACVAYDASANLYPKGAKAPDGLWRSINAYSDLYETEKRPWFKKAAQERLEQFAKNYPQHPNMVSVSLFEGQWAEADKDWKRAAEVYERVDKKSAAYGEAQYRAGSSLLKQAAALDDEKKTAEAAAARKKARPILETARTMLEQQMDQTLDPDARGRLTNLAFAARVNLARLMLMDGPAGAAEVTTMLEDLEQRYSGDDDKIAEGWRLRIKALEVQGKLDEAVEKLDALAQKSPDAGAIGPAAGSLARALDRAGNEAAEKDAKSPEARKLWLEAARLYALSVRPQVTGKAPPNARELEDVGKRLFAQALTFEGAPDDAESFLDWTPKHLSMPELWDQIGAIFQTLVSAGSSYQAEILLARVDGMQGKWREAATTYARLFDKDPIIGIDGRKFDPQKRQAKPDLVPAFIEWAMAENMAGKQGEDKERLARAGDLLDKGLANLPPNDRLWWRAKVLQIQTMVDRGLYDLADVALRNVERTTQDYDGGKYGAKEQLLALKAEIGKRVVPNNKAPAPKKPDANDPK